METRKVQVTGGATYTVSLPKAWVKETGLKAGATLGFIPQPDGTLLLTSHVVGGKEERKKVFMVADEDGEMLFRSLIGAYMMGYDVIEVRAKSRMDMRVRDIVRKFTQSVIGPEIIEEGINSVLTKDLLDPTYLSFGSILRRMYRIVEEMHRNALTSLREKNARLAEDVVSRDTEVDRLNWLVARQYNMLIRDIKLTEKMGTTREQGINFLLIARILERIGDHAVRIAENAKRLSAQPVKKEIVCGMMEIGTSALEKLHGSMNSLFKEDVRAANETIQSIDEFLEGCSEYSEHIGKSTGAIAIPLGYILESLIRTGLYARDISECVINYLVDVRS